MDVRGAGCSLAPVSWLAALAVSVGCQKASQPAGNAEVKPTYNKDTGQLERITYDRNHDGKPDAWLFMNGARVLMAQLDENFDGAIDRWEYYGDRPAGADAAPAPALPALPRSILERAEQATRGDGKVNRREWYENGQLARVEEDTNGDGRVDKWETWSAACCGSSSSTRRARAVPIGGSSTPPTDRLRSSKWIGTATEPSLPSASTR